MGQNSAIRGSGEDIDDEVNSLAHTRFATLGSLLRRRSRKIFLSYRRADAPDVAERLQERLGRQFGASNVFFDRADIEHGELWRDEVTRHIRAADTVLVLIGPKWLEMLRARAKGDDVLRFELATALEQKKQIIPVLIGATLMPHAGQLPQEVRGLTDFQALTISDDIDLAMLTLLGRVKPGWGLAVSWAFGNLGGWAVAVVVVVLALMAFGLVERGNKIANAAPVRLLVGSGVAGALLGTCVGFPQWLVLRPWFERARFLVPVYIGLCMIAIAVAVMSANWGGDAGPGTGVLMMVLLPVGFGVMLWWVVSKELAHAGWWSIANAAAPFIGLVIAGLNHSDAGKQQARVESAGVPPGLLPIVDFLLPIVFMSLLSGALLVWLMRISEIRRK